MEPAPHAVTDRLAAEALIVDVEGFEGPLDLLLMLSRTQKVDLRRISVLQLAEQYLTFVEQAKVLRIELAADYLVMAAWLAYLKSRLLLPPDPEAEGPSAEDMAAHPAWQLERLQAMRQAAATLMARDQLGREIFPRGQAEEVVRHRRTTYSASLIDLMRAYARLRTKDEFRPFVMDREHVFTMEQALDRMREMLGHFGDWGELEGWLPAGWDTHPMRRRSVTAAHFAAVLEMAKRGQLDLRQGETFAPIEIPEARMTDPLFAPPSMPEQERMVEAMLFASATPLGVAEIAARMPHGSDPAEILVRLRGHYEGRGVRLVRVGDAWASRTAPDLGHLMQREVVETRKLSRAAIETLAIVAYHQPVTRAEIEEIRGVAVSRGTIDQLLELEWIRLGRRRMSPGRPVTFVVTELFLDHFGLETARDLPGLKELREAGLLDNRPAPGALKDEGEDDLPSGQSELFEE